MKLLLLGCTGDVGGYVLRRVLEELPDAVVTIFVRNKQKLEQKFDRNRLQRAIILEGDAGESQALVEAFRGQEACICTVGNAAKDDSKQYQSIFAEVVKAAANNMTGPRRLWMMGGATVMAIPGSESRLTLNDLPIFAWLPFRVHSSNYQLLHGQSDLDWSLMCPGQLKQPTSKSAQHRVSTFTEEIAIWVPQWALKHPLLRIFIAFFSILQLSKFSVSLDDVAGIMVSDLKRRSPYSRLRVGMRKG